jgi:hypothetical protein
MRRWLAWSLVAVVLLVAAVVGGVASYRRVTYGSRYAEAKTSVSADKGSVFTLVVPDRGASVGDRWTAAVADPAVAEQVRSRLIADSLSDRLFGAALGGGGGQRLITFKAKSAGTTTITLSNCFQGCDNERTQADSRSVSWTVTVAS